MWVTITMGVVDFFYGAVVFVIWATMVTAFLPVLGILAAPIAWMVSGNLAKEHSLDRRLYSRLGAMYSMHMFIPWVYMIIRISGGNLPKWVVWTAVLHHLVIWVFCSFGLSAMVVHNHTEEFYGTGSIRGLPAETSHTVTLLLMLASPIVNAIAFVYVLFGMIRETVWPGKSRPGLPDSYMLPLSVLALVAAGLYIATYRLVSEVGPSNSDIPKFTVMISLVLASPVTAWVALIIPARRSYARLSRRSPEKVNDDILVPPAYLRVFPYSFMGFFLMLWCLGLFLSIR